MAIDGVSCRCLLQRSEELHWPAFTRLKIIDLIYMSY